MAQDDGKLEGNSQDRQRELEAGFLDWLSAFPDTASIADLARSAGSVVDAAKDPQARG